MNSRNYGKIYKIILSICIFNFNIKIHRNKGLVILYIVIIINRFLLDKYCISLSLLSVYSSNS